MEERYEEVLRIFYEASLKTDDFYVVSADIGRGKGEICHWLVENGYIRNPNPMGKDKFGCSVTQKTIHYFSNKEQ